MLVLTIDVSPKSFLEFAMLRHPLLNTGLHAVSVVLVLCQCPRLAAEEIKCVAVGIAEDES
jgi:hypothetical protein